MTIRTDRLEQIVRLARESIPLSPGSTPQIAADSIIAQAGSELNREERQFLARLISNVVHAILSTNYPEQLENTVTLMLAEEHSANKRLTLRKLFFRD